MEFMCQDGLSYTNNNNAKISGVHRDKNVLSALTTWSSQSATFRPPRPRRMEQPVSGTLLGPTAEGKSAGRTLTLAVDCSDPEVIPVPSTHDSLARAHCTAQHNHTGSQEVPSYCEPWRQRAENIFEQH